jgi:hypothetical protein
MLCRRQGPVGVFDGSACLPHPLFCGWLRRFRVAGSRFCLRVLSQIFLIPTRRAETRDVARMKRSGMRGFAPPSIPDSVALRPGYGGYRRLRSRPELARPSETPGGRFRQSRCVPETPLLGLARTGLFRPTWLPDSA